LLSLAVGSAKAERAYGGRGIAIDYCYTSVANQLPN